MAIQFPVSRVTPAEDQTERALHTVIDVVRDFEHALADAESVSKALQLRDRVRACIALLDDVQEAATRKADVLSEAKN